MYLGVDVGGTKTLVAVLNNQGVIVEQYKFPTPKNYDHWLLEFRHTLANFEHKDFKAAGVGVPATDYDRYDDIAVSFSNLPWHNVDIDADIEKIAKCPAFVENDAKLAGLSEWMVLGYECHSMIYVTISTGIGFVLIVDGVIDTSIGDGGGRTIVLEHKGKNMPWEDFAGGRAIFEHYKKKAMDIHDEETWTSICRNLAQGLIHLIAIAQPDVMVFGGSVGTYFDRYGKILHKELEKYKLPLIELPKLRGAKRPETAVVYGCYDYAKQMLKDLHGTHNS